MCFFCVRRALSSLFVRPECFARSGRKCHGVFPNNNLVVIKAGYPLTRNFYFDFLDYIYESQNARKKSSTLLRVFALYGMPILP